MALFLLFLPVFVLLLVAIFLFAAYQFDSLFGAEDFSTSRAAVKAVAAIIRQKHLEQGEVYDLGSARGNFVFKILDECPGLKVHGVDNSLFRTGFAKIRARFHPGPGIYPPGYFFNRCVKSGRGIYVFGQRPDAPFGKKITFGAQARQPGNYQHHHRHLAFCKLAPGFGAEY